MVQAKPRENLFLLFVNSNGANQTAHLRSLISTTAVPTKYNTIAIQTTSKYLSV